MKLAAKLVSILVVVITILLSIDGYLLVQRETKLVESDIQRDMLILGRTLKVLISEVWGRSGREHALSLIEDVEDSPVRRRDAPQPLSALRVQLKVCGKLLKELFQEVSLPAGGRRHAAGNA